MRCRNSSAGRCADGEEQARHKGQGPADPGDECGAKDKSGEKAGGQLREFKEVVLTSASDRVDPGIESANSGALQRVCRPVLPRGRAVLPYGWTKPCPPAGLRIDRCSSPW